jgi:hypothetical protein
MIIMHKHFNTYILLQGVSMIVKYSQRCLLIVSLCSPAFAMENIFSLLKPKTDWRSEVNNAQTELTNLITKLNKEMETTPDKAKFLLKIEIASIEEKKTMFTQLVQNAEQKNYTPTTEDLLAVNNAVSQTQREANIAIQRATSSLFKNK